MPSSGANRSARHERDVNHRRDLRVAGPIRESRWRVYHEIFSIFPVRALMVSAILLTPTAFAQTPEPTGWYAGDMHVHRSCGGSPEAVSSMFSRMTPQNLSAESLLADMGNGEVQNPVTDLPLVTVKMIPFRMCGTSIGTSSGIGMQLTVDIAHQALGGHVVGLGLSNAQQIWQENTFPILDCAHQQNAIAGFAHMQYLEDWLLPRPNVLHADRVSRRGGIGFGGFHIGGRGRR